MEFYEVMFLMDVNLPEDERRNIADEVEEDINELGGEIRSSDQWDVRELAYPIENAKRADFRLIEFKADPHGPLLDDLRERLNFRDNVIRFLITNQRKDRHPEAIFETSEEEEEETVDAT